MQESWKEKEISDMNLGNSKLSWKHLSCPSST
ncbi:hypothetical protein V6Z12_D13G223400 [Gossypium hirsutum]